MSVRRFVIALGGNAIVPLDTSGTYLDQYQITKTTMNQVAELTGMGHRVVLTHGNGPVVGNIFLRNEAGFATYGIPPMPLFVCGADSQGGLGYMIQQNLQNAMTVLGLGLVGQSRRASGRATTLVRSELPAETGGSHHC